MKLLWILLLFSCSGTHAAPRNISVNYYSSGNPFDLGIFYDAFGRAAVFWYQNCGVIFSISAIDEVSQPKETSEVVNIWWGPLPTGKLAATTNQTILGRWRGSMVTISPIVSNKNIERVLAHELGHVLGLEHVSDKRGMMSPELFGNRLSQVEIDRCRQ